jgi:lipopolysaccharide transport system ATP-binding protein
VGTGFHGELSGRENIFLNGAILGMSRAEVARKFDDIVAFAEVEKFIDTPVKRYSSGMYVRLAFGVAAFLEPEILIIDEVLAVGDSKFQEKCLSRISSASSREGVTVLFVSHNMLAVKRLCERAIWLNSGAKYMDGPADHVLQKYSESDANHSMSWRCDDSVLYTKEWGIVSIEIKSTGLQVDVHSGFSVVARFRNTARDSVLHVSINVYTIDGVHVLNSFPLSPAAGFNTPLPTGIIEARCDFPANLLNAGLYRLEVYLVRNQNLVVDHVESALVFEVMDVSLDIAWHQRWAGLVRPMLVWNYRVEDTCK